MDELFVAVKAAVPPFFSSEAWYLITVCIYYYLLYVLVQENTPLTTTPRIAAPGLSFIVAPYAD